jgi:hypothetical protein
MNKIAVALLIGDSIKSKVVWLYKPISVVIANEERSNSHHFFATASATARLLPSPVSLGDAHDLCAHLE